MKKGFIALLVVILIFLVVAPITEATSLTDLYCKNARHPGSALMCYWMLLMEFYNPLEWDDEDADNYASVNEMNAGLSYYNYCTDLCMSFAFIGTPRAC